MPFLYDLEQMTAGDSTYADFDLKTSPITYIGTYETFMHSNFWTNDLLRLRVFIIEHLQNINTSDTASKTYEGETKSGKDDNQTVFPYRPLGQAQSDINSFSLPGDAIFSMMKKLKVVKQLEFKQKTLSIQFSITDTHSNRHEAELFFQLLNFNSDPNMGVVLAKRSGVLESFRKPDGETVENVYVHQLFFGHFDTFGITQAETDQPDYAGQYQLSITISRYAYMILPEKYLLFNGSAGNDSSGDVTETVSP